MNQGLRVLESNPAGNWIERLIWRGIPESVAEERRGEVRNVDFRYLLDDSSNPKTAKSNKSARHWTAIMNLLPGGTCPWASKGCLKACLNTAGNPQWLQGKLRARRARTDLLRNDPELFIARLVWEIERFVAKCTKMGKRPSIRLNGTSDIPWEKVVPWLFERFPGVQFYDYTKGYHRLGSTPDNYWLTFSRSECNHTETLMALKRGFHVAVVVEAGKGLPKRIFGYKCSNGDRNDLIFLRRNPVQVLQAKGKAKDDESGFVVPRQ